MCSGLYKLSRTLENSGLRRKLAGKYGAIMKSVKATALTDAVIFTGEAFVENHALLLRGGRVLDIVRDNRIPADAEVVSHNGRIIAPAFVDCQVNGGGGALLNNSPTVETALTIAKAHAAHGTARLLLTCVSDTPEVMRSAANAAREARKQCDGILGIHFEGPHLGHERRGVHKAEYLRGMTAEDMDLYRPRGDEIVLVTVAPERVSADEIARLAGQGTKVSLGHTAADSSAIRAALKAGASCFTHLFNGMGGLAAREVTPATVALDDRDSWCGIIADGYHVSPETLRLAVRAKPAGKLFLVSDAMPPAGLETGRGGDFTLYASAKA